MIGQKLLLRTETIKIVYKHAVLSSNNIKIIN